MHAHTRTKASAIAVALRPARTGTHQLPPMATPTIDTPEYMLYPSPRNEHRVIFEHQCFVPYPYAIIHLPDFDFEGRATLFSARRKADDKNGQLVTCELEIDILRFERLFDPE